jgi:thymidine phosphorylase
MDDQQLFELKQKFLREVPHPTIIKNHIKRLDNSIGADEQINAVFVESESELENFLLEYQAKLMPIKLEVANGKGPEQLANSLLKLLKLQQNLIRKLGSYEIDSQSEKFKEIKLSTAFDTHKLMKFLRSDNIKESEINAYLWTAFEQSNRTEYSILTEAVVRAKKIIDYEQI